MHFTFFFSLLTIKNICNNINILQWKLLSAIPAIAINGIRHKRNNTFDYSEVMAAIVITESGTVNPAFSSPILHAIAEVEVRPILRLGCEYVSTRQLFQGSPAHLTTLSGIKR